MAMYISLCTNQAAYIYIYMCTCSLVPKFIVCKPLALQEAALSIDYKHQ